MQGGEPVEIVGEVGAPVGLADAEGLVFAAVGGRQVIDARQQRAEGLAVGADAADRRAAEADARDSRVRARSAAAATPVR